MLDCFQGGHCHYVYLLTHWQCSLRSVQQLWNLEGGKLPASWETQCSPVSLNDCIHIRLGSSRFECWQIGPAVGPLGSMLCSHAFGFNIKQLTESTLDYLSFSFTAVDTGDPHHSCRSPHSYTHTHSLSLSLSCTHTHAYNWAQVFIQMHTGEKHARPCIYTYTHLWLVAMRSCTHTHRQILANVELEST